MAAEKRQLTAVQKGKRGAVIGFIAVELIMILVQASVGASMSDILAGMCMGPAGLLYGFGYVFGWQWTLRWAAGALHYSGHVLDAGFIWWICTGRKGGILRGLWFSLLLISFAVGLAWIPGVVKGIKEIRAEKKNRAVSETDYAVKREKRKKLRKEEPVPVVQSQPVVEKQQPTVLETPKVAANACYVDCYGGEFNGASFDMREILQLVFDEMDGKGITISVGIALAPEHGKTYMNLYRSADQALYETKRNGRNGFTIYGENRDITENR